MSALQSDPSMLPRMQIDKGGIRFIMVRSEHTAAGYANHYLSPTHLTSIAAVQNGADVMCPGLTSAGAEMADAEAGDVVVRMLCACLSTASLSAGPFLRRGFMLKASSMRWLLEL
jgi:thiamine pyrophosphate-dependent acetolactate synthase large subunit-like protein